MTQPPPPVGFTGQGGSDTTMARADVWSSGVTYGALVEMREGTLGAELRI